MTRRLITPGLSAWYGDPEGTGYDALGKSVPLPWITELLELRHMVEMVAGIILTVCCLIITGMGRIRLHGTVTTK